MPRTDYRRKRANKFCGDCGYELARDNDGTCPMCPRFEQLRLESTVPTPGDLAAHGAEARDTNVAAAPDAWPPTVAEYRAILAERRARSTPTDQSRGRVIRTLGLTQTLVPHPPGAVDAVTYRHSGFDAPVDMTPSGAAPVINTIDGGSTVPLKFAVFAGSAEITSTGVVKSYTYKELNCSSLGATSVDDLEQVTPGGTSLRYDSTAGRFIQNWQTPKTVGKCYLATITLADGSTISAYFKTK